MECTRTVNKVYAMKHGLLLHQRMSVRQLVKTPVVQRPCRAIPLMPAAVTSFAGPISSGSASLPASEKASRVIDIASGESFQEVLAANPQKLVVLMCKATGCRPCRQFHPKFAKLAEHYQDAVFCEILGDRNESTRRLMRSLKIRATPTFVFHRNGEQVHAHSGISAQKMVDALKVAVLPSEIGFCEEVKFAVDLLNH